MVSLPLLFAGLLVMGLMAASIDAALRCSLRAIARQPELLVATPGLTVVDTQDRRNLHLPFVGKDRRQVNVETQADAPRLTGTTDARPGQQRQGGHRH